MINIETGEKDTEHSSNPVPCWLITPENYKEKAEALTQSCDLGCMIADIAPTVLGLMGEKPPANMTGKNLLEYLK